MMKFSNPSTAGSPVTVFNQISYIFINKNILVFSEAICGGFVYQFFVIYRYMFSSVELYEFFKQNFIKASLM